MGNGAKTLNCLRCGQVLDDLSPPGLCSHCLLLTGLETAPAARGPEEMSNAALRCFGDYELLEEIARGGMGVVYKARQKSLNRLVAVKLLLFGQYSSPEFVHRFRVEASAAASLQHPNIVAIHEVGVHQDQHYFAMDFVEGLTLGETIQNERLSARRAARYAKLIADAIQFAHQRHIVHRDLKPSNVMIDLNDQPRVTDFGLAKNLSENSDLTLTGQVLGSPNYMPPEQASGQRGQIGPASDVYSIGAMLYHMLSGRPPFAGENMAETIQQVLNSDPVSIRMLNPSVPADLETVCLKCLEKQPARRYESAQALADELGRVLNDQPIKARPVTLIERSWRWCCRNRSLSSSLAAILILLLTVATGAPLLLWRVSQARRSAEEQLYIANIHQASEALEGHDFPRARDLLRQIEETSAQRAMRGWEWRFLNHQVRSDHAAILGRHNSWLADLTVSRNESLLATISEDGMVKLWALNTQLLVAQWQAHAPLLESQPDIFRHSIVFTPDGKTLVTAGHDRTIHFWDVNSRGQVGTIGPLPAAVLRIAISPNGRLLAGLSFRGDLTIWNLSQPSPEMRTHFSADETGLMVGYGIAFSPDGTELLGGSADNPIRRYHVSKEGRLEFIGTIRESSPPFAFSPDGQQLVTCGTSRRIARRWSWPDPHPLVTLGISGGNADGFVFSPDHRTLAAALGGGQINVWEADTESGTIATTLYGHEEPATAVSFLSGGPKGRLVSISADKTVRLWDLAQERKENILSMGAPVFAIAFSPDSRYLAAAVRASSVPTNAPPGQPFVMQLWDLQSRLPIASTPFGSNGLGPGLRFAPNGALIAASDYSVLQFFQIPSLQIKATAGDRCPVFSSKGDWLAYVDGDQIVKRSSLVSRPAFLARHPPGDEINALGLSDEGTLLASSSAAGPIYLWNARNGDRISILNGHRQRVPVLLLSKNGQRLVSAGWDGQLGIWDTISGRNLAFLSAHNNSFNYVALSPDDRTIASCGDDNDVRLWNLAYPQELAVLRGHTDTVNSVAFSPNGEWLASASNDGTIKLWEAPAGTTSH